MLHRVLGEENRRMRNNICRDDWESSRTAARGQSSESGNPTIPHGRHEGRPHLILLKMEHSLS